jgi:hypothetical protein
MSAKKTVFPTAVQYQKEKFDPSLKLQRFKDTAKQAAQPFVEEAQAIKTQALIDENYFELQNQLDKQELLYGGQDETFLQKLAPFSPIIKAGFAELAKRVDERKKKAVDQVQGQLEQMAINGQDLSQITKQVNGLMQRADKSGQIGLLHNLSKLDWGQQAQVADGLVKNTVKNYKTSLETFQRDFGPISNDAEAQALVLAHDNRYRDMFEQMGAPASMYQNWFNQSAPARQKALNGMVDNIRGLQGEEIRNTAYNSLYSNAQLLDVERRAMLSPKDRNRTFGKASAHTDMLKFLEKAIKAGDFNQANINGWKDEIHPVTKKRIGDMADYQYFFGQLDRYLKSRQDEDAGNLDNLISKRREEWTTATLNNALNKGITETDVDKLEEDARLLGIMSPDVLQMLKYLRDGKTQEDKADAAVTAELKARLDTGAFMSDAELLSYGQTNFNSFRATNDLNRSIANDAGYKQGEKEILGWMKQDPRDTEAISEKGGGLGITQVDKVKTQGEIRILNEVSKIYREKYNQIAGLGGPDAFRTGQIDGTPIHQLAVAESIKEINRRKAVVTDPLYYNPKTNQFEGTLNIKTNEGYVKPTDTNSVYVEVGKKLETFKTLEQTHGYNKILTTEALLSQVIPREEAARMKSRIERGLGIPAAIVSIAALSGNGQVRTAEEIFKTHNLGELILPEKSARALELLNSPEFQANFDLQEALGGLKDIHSLGARGQERLKAQARRAVGQDDAPGALRTNYLASQNLSPEKRALLRTLKWAEGSDYGTLYGGAVVPEIAQGMLTVQEMINMADTGRLPDHLGGRSVNFGSGSKAAAGYQFMPGTLEDLIRQGVLRPDQYFTPQIQDMAALALTGLSEDVLNSELKDNHWDKLAPTWASIPLSSTGRSYYAGDGLNKSKSPEALKKYYLKVLQYERMKGLI